MDSFYLYMTGIIAIGALVYVFLSYKKWIFFGYKIKKYRKKYRENMGFMWKLGKRNNLGFPDIINMSEQIREDGDSYYAIHRDLMNGTTFMGIPMVIIPDDDLKTSAGIYMSENKNLRSGLYKKELDNGEVVYSLKDKNGKNIRVKVMPSREISFMFKKLEMIKGKNGKNEISVQYGGENKDKELVHEFKPSITLHPTFLKATVLSTRMARKWNKILDFFKKNKNIVYYMMGGVACIAVGAYLSYMIYESINKKIIPDMELMKTQLNNIVNTIENMNQTIRMP